MKHRIAGIRVIQRVEARPSWNMGIMLRYLADIQTKLADLAEGVDEQKEILEKAALAQEEGLKIATEHVQSMERGESHAFRGPLARYHFEHASVLQRLCSITQDQQYLRRAAEQYSSAGGAAECYWKSAETYDSLQAHSLASETFLLAAKAYETLGKNTLPLKDLAQDYARYMDAWSKIELARSVHRGLQYTQAAKAYNNAARLHKSTKRWRFLAPYYSAWSSLEIGENLSKNGHRRKAIGAFRKAIDLFVQSTTLLKDKLVIVNQPDEKKMVSMLANAPKRDYCEARVILEEAMIAESKEDHQNSFEKFGLASEKFREVSEQSESKQDRDETGFLSTLCRAWQLSSKAELEGSIEVLQQAATYFGEAKEMSPSQSAKKLAEGHEEFCKALIASRRFADTLDPQLHREASGHLDLASGCYLDSGFKTAADHALGRKLLLDAFARLNEANNEEDPKKKARLYLATSTLLRESASAFRRARRPRKMEQARDLLKRTRIESKIASQLTEILDAALQAPTNVAFHTPTQGNEKPVGLNRFDRADIEVRLSKIRKGPRPGKEIELQFEITNTGKQPVGLLRIDDALPNGTELREPLEQWKLQGRSLVPLQSSRINMLQTEPMKLLLQVKEEGILRIEPRIIFADPSGREHERMLEPKLIATSQIMEFLANSFVKDYVSRRLAIPSCGWRTLMEIVQDLKIPRSHVYGEPRYGRTFGRQLDTLVKSSIVEYRIFPGERGRGGDITRVRVQLANPNVRGYLEDLVPALGVRGPVVKGTIKLDDLVMASQITVSP
jgi:tetratricopeptide (TPR) repeat protein